MCLSGGVGGGVCSVGGGVDGGVDGGGSSSPYPGGVSLPSVSQELPNTGFSRPIRSAVLPQAFTGTSTGTWALLPEPTPGDPSVWPWAEEPDGVGLPPP